MLPENTKYGCVVYQYTGITYWKFDSMSFSVLLMYQNFDIQLGFYIYSLTDILVYCMHNSMLIQPLTKTNNVYIIN